MIRETRTDALSQIYNFTNILNFSFHIFTTHLNLSFLIHGMKVAIVKEVWTLLTNLPVSSRYSLFLERKWR